MALATSVASARVGTGGGDHRVEHLGGGDRGAGQAPGDTQQLLLDDRDVLDRQLDTQVAAGHHDRVSGADDLLGVVDSLRLLDLGHQGQPRVAPDGLDILGAAHEGQRHDVDADRLAEAEHVQVLLGHRHQAARVAGDVQALARGDRAADLDDGVDLALAAADLLDAEADRAVGEIDDVVGIHALRQAGPRDRHPPAVAGIGGAAGEQEPLAGLELDPVLGERADAQLGPGQVLEDRHGATDGRRRRAYTRCVLGVHLAVAVREVQAGDVEPGRHHPRERFRVAGGGADGGNDLRAAHLQTNVLDRRGTIR